MKSDEENYAWFKGKVNVNFICQIVRLLREGKIGVRKYDGAPGRDQPWIQSPTE